MIIECLCIISEQPYLNREHGIATLMEVHDEERESLNVLVAERSANACIDREGSPRPSTRASCSHPQNACLSNSCDNPPPLSLQRVSYLVNE